MRNDCAGTSRGRAVSTALRVSIPLLAGLALGACADATAPTAPASNPGPAASLLPQTVWTPLFNGTNLSDWTP